MSYLRRIELIVDNVSISSDRVVEDQFDPKKQQKLVRGFDIEFEVKQSLDSKENTCNAKVVNLGETTRNMLSNTRDVSKPGPVPTNSAVAIVPSTIDPTILKDGGTVVEKIDRVTVQGKTFTAGPLGITIYPHVRNNHFEIYAGYQDASRLPGCVFRGEYKRVWSEKTATEWNTHISASDGHQAKLAIVNGTFDPQTGFGEALATLAASFGGAATSAIQMIKDRKYVDAVVALKGLAVSGSARDEIDKLTTKAGLDWTIVNSNIVMLHPEEVSPGTIVILDDDSGLIGSPEPHFIEKHKDRIFLKVRSLLNPDLTPGRGVVLNSRQYTGEFKVIVADHKGRTREDSFHSDLIIMALKKGIIQTFVPDRLYSDTQSLDPNAMQTTPVLNYTPAVPLPNTSLTTTVALPTELETIQTEGYVSGVPFNLTIAQIAPGVSVEVETAKAFMQMRKAAARDGINLTVNSGFRSFAEQSALYEERKTPAARAKLGVAAKPGYSNHQSGIALDINTGLSVSSFAKGNTTETYRWLRDNASKYGFTRTVPSEPWHWEKTGPITAQAQVVIANSISEAGRAFIKQYETFSAKAYFDIKGLSIGYGHQLTEVDYAAGLDKREITLAEAETLFSQDLKRFEAALNKVLPPGTTQNQFDAVGSLMYNFGVTAISNSTLVRLMNAGDVTGAAEQFKDWVHARDKAGQVQVLQGLVTRRQAERAVFIT